MAESIPNWKATWLDIQHAEALAEENRRNMRAIDRAPKASACKAERAETRQVIASRISMFELANNGNAAIARAIENARKAGLI